MIEIIAAIIAAMLAPCPNHPAHGHEQKIASECVAAAERYGQDPVELVTWAFYESSLRPGSIGGLGEVGYMQVHGRAAAACEAVGEVPGSFGCGAYLWNFGEKLCGTHERALWWYASGKCDGTPRAKRIVKFRERQVEKWKQ